MAESRAQSLLYTLLGLNRTGQAMYLVVVALGVLSLGMWQTELARWRFSEADEGLFRAARHGDVSGIERSLAAGAGVNDAAPTDGKTALFRAAVFGRTDAVRTLLEHGADPHRRGNDGKTALETVLAIRGEEKNPPAAKALDDVVAALRKAEESQ